MTIESDDSLFSDEISDEQELPLPTKGEWKVLIVDDEKDVHEITKLLFKNFEFENKQTHFFSAYSAREAKEVIKENPDIALVILDVVMEEDDSGLKFVKYLREELNNKLIRIIIRTGQPGQAPERKVNIEYDINDYKEKTELTQDKFYSSLIMALRSYRDLIEIQRSKDEILKLLNLFDKFVPHHFLRILNEKDITAIKLGDYTELDLTVMFLDIRSYTATSEKLTPVENFNFINSLLENIEPPIIRLGGLIDKYIGDSIMALFFGKTDASITAAIEIFKALDAYNLERKKLNQHSIEVGISINSGIMALGTIGFHDRMDCTVIGSTVNTAAKLEKMNKELGTRLLVTGELQAQFKTQDKFQFQFRHLGKVKIIGKPIPIDIMEILDVDPESVKSLKIQSKPLFELAISSFEKEDYKNAKEYFQQIYSKNNKDNVAAYFIRKCESFEKAGKS